MYLCGVLKITFMKTITLPKGLSIRLPKLPPYLIYDLVFWGFIVISLLFSILVSISVKGAILYWDIVFDIANYSLIGTGFVYGLIAFKGQIERARLIDGILMVVVCSLFGALLLGQAAVLLSSSVVPQQLLKSKSRVPIMFAIGLADIGYAMFKYYSLRNASKQSKTLFPPLFFYSYMIAFLVEFTFFFVCFKLF